MHRITTIQIGERRLYIEATAPGSHGLRDFDVCVDTKHYPVPARSFAESVARALTQFLREEGDAEMKKADVEIGQDYVCKVSGKLTRVRIDRTSVHGGWEGTNMETKRTVRIKSGQRLRKLVGPGQRKAKTAKPTTEPATPATPAAPGKEAARPEAAAQAAQATPEERICYLCKKPIRNGDAQPIGKGLFRHNACDPAEAETKKADAAKGRKLRAKGAAASGEGKKPSLMDAAIQIMREVGQPMGTKDVVEKILAKGLWTTKGATPGGTLYAAILREIQKKGNEARFVKTDKGRFALRA